MVFKYLEDIKYRKDQTIRKVMEGFSKTAIHTDSSGFGVIVDDNDQCIAGYMHLFNPSSTTFVKHFISRIYMEHY